MDMLKNISAFAVIGTATLVLAGCQTIQSADERPGFSHEVFNVEKVSCWELSTLAEEDAGYAATLIYGYQQGRLGDATQTPSKIENALSEISRKCVGQPDQAVIDTFK